MTSPSQPSTTIELDVLADEDIDAFFAFEDLWAVIVWNDDVTTFQTVIQAFVEIFGHTVERADKLAQRQSLMVPAEEPGYQDLGPAFPAWAQPRTGAILQPPRPQIPPSGQILERIAGRDLNREAAD